MTPIQIEREEIKKERQKWLKKEGFNPYTGKLHLSDKLIIPNYVIQSPGKSLHKYSFRDENKQKWLKKKAFIVGRSNDLLI